MITDKRMWEVNYYNNLGYICDGYTVTETNRGHKNETREATSIEVCLFERFLDDTPEFPVIEVEKDINPLTVLLSGHDDDFVWVRQDGCLFLYRFRDGCWSERERYIHDDELFTNKELIGFSKITNA
jgi:hypothetical protein